MVAWLVHFEDALTYDAKLVLDATAHTLHALGTALLRHESHPPERYPKCDSYRIILDFRPELNDLPYVVLCKACGWEEKTQAWCSEEARDAARRGQRTRRGRLRPAPAHPERDLPVYAGQPVEEDWAPRCGQASGPNRRDGR